MTRKDQVPINKRKRVFQDTGIQGVNMNCFVSSTMPVHIRLQKAVMLGDNVSLEKIKELKSDNWYKIDEKSYRTIFHCLADTQKYNEDEKLELFKFFIRPLMPKNKFILRAELLNAVDNSGFTAMMYCIKHGLDNFFAELVKFSEIDVISQGIQGNSMLHWLAHYARLAMIQKFIRYNQTAIAAQCEVKNNIGQTPLHVAYSTLKAYHLPDALRVANLLKLFTDKPMLIRDINGNTPLDLIATESEVTIDSFNYQEYPVRDLLAGLEKTPAKIAKNGLERLSKTIILTKDLAQGREKMPIPVVTDYKKTQKSDIEALVNFKYVTDSIRSNVKVPKDNIVLTQIEPCHCKNTCDMTCKCYENWQGVSLTVGYRSRIKFCKFEDVHLLDIDTLNLSVPVKIQECGDLCGCHVKMCPNRLTQKGMQFATEVFFTGTYGWGVRAVNTIPSGAFIGFYRGEIVSEDMASKRDKNDTYLFEVSPHISLDANSLGNFTRFINHLCEPNVLVVTILKGHSDDNYAEMAFFTKKKIPPGQELGFDYGHRYQFVVKK